MSAMISVVVPVTAASQDVDLTLRSLDECGDANLEVLVERDGGLGDLLNRGFARAHGEIRSFLRPGERLLPSALAGARSGINAEAGRLVIMGSAAILVDGISPFAVDHPAEYRGFPEHLEIWERRFDTVAYSSLFWHRAAQEAIGGFADGGAEATVYDFACRLGARNAVHKIEALWSMCFLRPDTSAGADGEVLDELVAVSRRYWGSWFSPLRWRCEASYRRYASHAHDRARHHARRAEAACARGDRLGFMLGYVRTWLCAPDIAHERLGGLKR